MAYSTEQLDQLLDRYFAGQTSLSEEKKLRQWLNSPELPIAYEMYTQLFDIWEEKKAEHLDDAFFQSFEQALHRQVQPLTPASSRGRLRSLFWLRTAAAVLLLATAGYWMWSEQAAPTGNTIDWAQYEPETPEEAFRVYRNAMQKLSGDIRQGSARAAQKVDRLHDAGAYFK